MKNKPIVNKREIKYYNGIKSFNKVFGVGMPKTGTTSLANAFRRIGFTAKHYSLNEKFEGVDMACDFPVQARFRKLDKKFPGSKFILTIREEQSWLGSYERHLKDRERIDKTLDTNKLTKVNRLRAEMYGTHRLNLNLVNRVRKEHEQEVLDYFKDRPDDLLIIDITQDPNPYKTICDFLGVSNPPEEEFPHKNKSKEYLFKKE